jgi:hypothetical protein
MSAAFVPLLPSVTPKAAPASVGLRVKIASPAPGAAASKPPALAPAAASAPLAASAAVSHSDQPAITLQRDGERITAIQIQCACGQLIHLDCEYQPAAEGK